MSDARPHALAEYTRVVAVDDGHRFEVARLHWPQVGESERVWRPFRHWKRPPDAAQIRRAEAAALRHPRYFRPCSHCGESTPSGGHHGDHCHPCAATVLGLRF